MLCLDHGTYPYVTSSSPTGASVPLNCGGLLDILQMFLEFARLILRE